MWVNSSSLDSTGLVCVTFLSPTGGQASRLTVAVGVAFPGQATVGAAHLCFAGCVFSVGGGATLPQASEASFPAAVSLSVFVTRSQAPHGDQARSSAFGSFQSVMKMVCKEQESFLSSSHMFLDLPRVHELMGDDKEKFNIPEGSSKKTVINICLDCILTISFALSGLLCVEGRQGISAPPSNF